MSFSLARDTYWPLFEAQVARTPELVAVQCEGRTLTYRELHRRARHLGGVLTAQGVGVEDVVALLMERELELLESILGVLAAGAAYLPLDPKTPVARWTQTLTQARPRALIHRGIPSAQLAQMREGPQAPPAFELEAMRAAPALPGASPGVVPGSLAYVIFTSGSTGAPKGAMLEHRGFLNHMFELIRILEMTGADVFAQTAPQCFDISVWQFLTPLLLGGRVEIVPQDVVEDPARLLDLLQVRGISLLEPVPSLLRALLDEARRRGEQRPALERLRWVIPTGEALPRVLAQEWLESYPRVFLTNAYGPTECSDDVTVWSCRSAAELDSLCIGRPLANLHAYVLDESLRPRPVGEVGELCIGGVGVGRGYVNAPVLTAEAFLPDPFCGDVGARMYRTGDLVRRRSNGELEFLGRRDFQVKLRGFRIELGDVESALESHPGVSGAIAVLGGPEGRPQLFAYVTPKPGGTPDAVESSALRAFVRGRLPPYMVPAAVHTLEAFPLGPNGKVDRRALEQRAAQEPVGSGGVKAPPRDDRERTLRDLWRAVLRLEDVGVDEDVFELGADSISAIQVSGRARAAGLILPVSLLFAHRTLEAQARVAVVAEAPTPVAPVGSGAGRYALTPLQEGMLFHALEAPERNLYASFYSFRIDGPLDVPALTRAWQRLVDREPALRSAFEWEGLPRPLQRIEASLQAPLKVMDLRSLPEPERGGRLAALERSERARPLELSRAPLGQATLVRMTEAHCEFFWLTHHANFDGWSFDILLRTLFALYAEERAPGTPGPPSPPPFEDFLAWSAQDRSGSDAAFWRTRLEGVAAFSLPMDLEAVRGEVPAGSYGVLTELVSREEQARLREMSSATGVTLSTLVHGAWGLVLSRYSGRDDVLFGSVTSGRASVPLPRMDERVGCFINTLPCRVRISPEGDVLGWLLALQAERLLALAHEHSPLGRVREWAALGTKCEPFDSVLAYQSFPESPGLGRDQGLTVETAWDTDRSSVPLLIEVNPKAQLELRAVFDLGLFSERRVRGMLSHFRRVLCGLASHLEGRLAGVEMLSHDERRLLLERWNAPGHSEVPGGSLVELFAVQARLRPDAIAMTFEGRSWSYHQLDAASARLALTLRERDVGPETVVASRLPRGDGWVLGYLATLRAGGAHLYLGPDVPPERLKLIYEDLRPQVVLGGDAEPPAHRVEVDVPGAHAYPGPVPSLPYVTPADPQLAFIVFTSGTTGRPKGVMVTHEALLRVVTVRVEHQRLGPGSRVHQWYSPSFDMATLELFASLCSGATLVIAAQDEILPGPDFIDRLRRERITHLGMTASAFAALPDAALPELEVFSSAGELVPTELVERLSRARPFEIGYAPAETSILCSHLMLEDARGGPPGLIGRPMPHARMYVLDPGLRLLPPGVPGEIFIGGAVVTRGYVNRPAFTAERFLPDPYALRPGARMYRTGDLGYHLPDGVLVTLGREDRQVKIRGFRVELFEVEKAVAAHPDVAQAAVVLREDARGLRQLVAYVTPREGRTVDAAALREQTLRRVPDYMVPSAFRVIVKMPLSANGKIDVRALAGLRELAPRPHAGPTATEAERVVSQAFASALRLASVGRDEHFFQLGGDSILTIQVVSHLRRAGYVIRARDIFTYPTVAELAFHVQERAPDPGLNAVSGDAPAPLEAMLTPTQRWFFEAVRVEPQHFTQAMKVELSPQVDARLLERALRALVVARPELARQYEETPGASAATHAELVLRALAFAPGDAGGTFASALETLQGTLDPGQGRLVAALLAQEEGTDRRTFVLALHHLVVDAVSWKILWRELARGYNAQLAGEAASERRTGPSFATYARRMERRRSAAELAASRTHFRSVVEAPVSPLPRETERSRVLEERWVHAVLSPGETTRLRRVTAAAWGCSVRDLLLAAVAHALGQEVGGERLRIAIEAHGRQDPLGEPLDWSDAVGWFTSLFPLLLEAGGDERARAERVRDRFDAVPNEGQGLDYGVLWASGRMPRIDVIAPIVFNYLGLTAEEDLEAEPLWRAAPQWERRSNAAQGQERPFELEWEAAIEGGALRVSIGFGAEGPWSACAAPLLEACLQGLRSMATAEVSSDVKRPRPVVAVGLRPGEQEVVLGQLGDAAVESVFPLTSMQHALLADSLAESGFKVNGIQSTLHFEGPLDVPALKRAWEAVVARHAMLRAVPVWVGLERPLFAILRAVTLPWRVVEVDDGQEDLRRVLETDWAEPMSLQRAPLLDVQVVKLGDGKHVCAWTAHHLVLDGWSLPLVVDAVLRRYREEVHQEGEKPPPTAPSPVPSLPELVRAQADVDLVAAEVFFRDQLHGFETATPLPAATRRTAGPGAPFAVAEVPLGAALLETLERTAKRAGVSSSTVAHAAWALLLSRHAQAEDVVFGSVFSGRSGAEMEGSLDTLGCFFNMLPLRVRCEDGVGVWEWLRRLQLSLLELQEHERVPLPTVQRFSPVPAGAPLFESSLVYENYPARPLPTLPNGLQVREGPTVELPRAALTVAFDVRGQVLRFGYDRRRFEPDQLPILAQQFLAVVSGLSALQPDAPLRALRLEAPWGRTAWASLGRGVAASPTPARDVVAAIEAAALRSPEAEAIRFGEVTWSYRRLMERAEQVAAYVQGQGLGAEDVVAVAVPRSPEMVAAFLGVLGAGAAFCHLDAAMPEERLRALTATLRPARVFTLDPENAAPPWAGTVKAVALGPLFSGAVAPQQYWTSPGPEALAYVVNTSGTTGAPKGVMVSRGAFSRFIRDQAELLDLSPGCRVLQFLSPSFDAALYEIFCGLVSGACLVLVPPAEALPSAELITLLKRERVTHAAMTGSALAALPEAALPALRCLVVGGETCPEEVLRRWSVGRQVVVGYGPAEATIQATVALSAEGPLPTATLGRPMAGRAVYLLDAALERVPRGAAGELCLGGDGLGRGYREQAGLTAERFLPDPFSLHPGARMYRTGDVARFRPDGTLEFLGRRDRQVKLRGVRIELGEVESALERHPRVRQAVVTVHDAPGARRLVAYLVSRAGPSLSVSEARAHAREHLAEAQRPAAYVVMASLPQTLNGKVDLAKLPPPVWEDADHTFISPRDPTEAALASLWQEVLQVPRISADADFFEVGGDSLLAIRLSGRSHARGIPFAPKELLRARTLEALAKLLAERPAAPPDARVELPTVSHVDGELPLLPAQEGLLFHSVDGAGDPNAYAAQLVFELRGELDLGRLRSAWATVMARHSALRASFSLSGAGGPVQRIHPTVEIPWTDVDLRGLAAQEREPRARALLEEQRREPFALDAPPLMRLSALRLEDDVTWLAWFAHHAITDGGSSARVLEEVFSRYGNPEAPLETPADYAAFVRAVRAQRVDDEPFWRARLEDAPGTALPLEQPNPRVVAGEPFGFFELPLAVEQTRALLAAARAAQVTLSDLVHAAWALVLSRYLGVDDVVMGTVTSGRSAPHFLGVERVVGCLISTLPLRLRWAGAETVKGFLSQVHDEQLALREQELTPLRVVQRAVGQSGSTLFRSFVVFESYAVAAPVQSPSLQVTELLLQERSHYPLALVVHPGERLALGFSFQRARFEAADIEVLAQHTATALGELAAKPGARMGELDVLSAPERAALCRGGGREAPAQDRGTFQALFEAQVARTPDAVALSAGTERVGYRELDERANAIAVRLHELGVGPESRVAIEMERSLLRPVVTLAVLKAGAAFVSIDPAYPDERARWMLEDSGVRVRIADPGVAARRAFDGVTLFAPALQGRAPHPPQVPRLEAGAAYVLYTSGSTGRPKGVVVSHLGMGTVLQNQRMLFGPGPRDAVVQLASPSFDAYVFELVMALLTGARLAIPPAEVQGGLGLVDELERAGVTHAVLTPSVLGTLPKRRLEALRVLMAAGEACAPALVERWSPGRAFWNLYGPTEMTIWSTAHRCLTRAPVSIGRPLVNTRAYVLDGALRPVPRGARGELFLAGPGMARGYLGRPGLSAERFLPDPYAAHSGERMYRTGDIVRLDRDGSLEFIGRVDLQVKLRGQRIELGEIEAVLAASPGVGEAVVMLEDGEGTTGPRLVAYLTGAGGVAVDVKAVASRVRGLLSSAMNPAVFVALPSLPLTANGKMDRTRLAAHRPPSPPGDEAVLAARTPREALLVRIFAEVLGLPTVGVEANFFSLGGDSIGSIRVSSLALEAGWKVSPRMLVEAPTIEALAEQMLEVRRGDDAVPLEGPVPLTPIQRWFFEQAPRQPSHFNQSISLELGPTTDPVQLRAALNSVVAAHGSFGMRYAPSPGGWEARWHGVEEALSWEETGLDGTWSALVAEAQARLDVTRGPLARAVLVRRPEGSLRLLLVVHHLAVDVVSWGVLLEELERTYAQLTRASGPEPRSGSGSLSHPQYAQALARHADSSEVHRALPHWRQAVEGAVEALPRDRPSGIQNVRSARELTFHYPAEELRGLFEAAQRTHRERPLEVLVTALFLALRRWTGRSAFRVGMEGHGRGELVPGAEVTRTVGWMTSFFPVLLGCPPQAPLEAVVASVRAAMRAVPDAGQGVSYGVLRYLSTTEEAKTLRTAPEPELTFNYLGRATQLPPTALFPGGVSWEAHDWSPEHLRPHLFELNAWESPEGLELSISYSPSLHDEATVERLGCAFVLALGDIRAFFLAGGVLPSVPADFALSPLDEEQLGDLMRELE